MQCAQSLTARELNLLRKTAEDLACDFANREARAENNSYAMLPHGQALDSVPGREASALEGAASNRH